MPRPPQHWWEPAEALGRWWAHKSSWPFPTVRDDKRWRWFGGDVQSKAEKIQGGVRARIIGWKKRKCKIKMHILLFKGGGMYVCTLASTLSWKKEELLSSYSKSKQITPCKQPIALGKHSLFQRCCSAASAQAGMPVFLHCLGASLWCWFWCRETHFPLFQSLLSQCPSGPCWERWPPPQAPVLSGPGSPQSCSRCVATVVLQRGKCAAGTTCHVLMHQAGS